MAKLTLACWLGFHDWEYTLCKSEDQAWVDYKYLEKRQLVPASSPTRALRKPGIVFIRACLRCGRVEDTHTPFISKRKQQVQHWRRRRDKAQELIDGV